jgi:hypothetical protein
MTNKWITFLDLVELAERAQVEVEIYDLLEILAASIFKNRDEFAKAFDFIEIRRQDLIKKK